MKLIDILGVYAEGSLLAVTDEEANKLFAVKLENDMLYSSTKSFKKVNRYLDVVWVC